MMDEEEKQIILPANGKWDVVLKLSDITVLRGKQLPDGRNILEFCTVAFPCPNPACKHTHEVSALESETAHLWFESIFCDGIQQEVKCHACGDEMTVRRGLLQQTNRGDNRATRRAKAKSKVH